MEALRAKASCLTLLNRPESKSEGKSARLAFSPACKESSTLAHLKPESRLVVVQFMHEATTEEPEPSDFAINNGIAIFSSPVFEQSRTPSIAADTQVEMAGSDAYDAIRHANGLHQVEQPSIDPSAEMLSSKFVPPLDPMLPEMVAATKDASDAKFTAAQPKPREAMKSLGNSPDDLDRIHPTWDSQENQLEAGGLEHERSPSSHGIPDQDSHHPDLQQKETTLGNEQVPAVAREPSRSTSEQHFPEDHESEGGCRALPDEDDPSRTQPAGKGLEGFVSPDTQAMQLQALDSTESGTDANPQANSLIEAVAVPHAYGADSGRVLESRPVSAANSATSGVGKPRIGENERRNLAVYHLYQRTVQEERAKNSTRPGSAKRLRPSSAAPPGVTDPAGRSHEDMAAPHTLHSNPERRKLVSRPTSAQASESERLKDQMRSLLRKPVRSWEVAEVSNWVAAIGLPQYRKRFIHQRISGGLLLRLSHTTLKVDLEIGVLGHRDLLLSAIKALPKLRTRSSLAPLEGDGLPVDSPESPVLKAKQLRQRLLRDLEKAEAHTASLNSKLQGTSRQAELAKHEVLHLRGSIADLENHYHLSPAGYGGARFSDVSPGVQHTTGLIPWHPNGAPFELTIPKIEKEMASLSPVRSRPSSAAPQAMNTSSQSAFLDRVTRDLSAREHRLKEMMKTYHSPESLFKDPDYSLRARAADLATANAYLNSTLSVSLDDLQTGQMPLARLKPERQPSLKKGSGTLQSSSSMVLRQDQENAKELASVSSPELLSASAETTLTEPSGGDLSLPAIQEGDENLSTPSASLQRQGSASSSRFRSLVRFQNSGDRTSQQQQSLAAVLEFLAGELRGKLNISQQQAQSVLKAKGEDKKLHRFAAAVREANFLGRHDQEKAARETRLQQSREHWHNVEMQPLPLPRGRGQKFLRPTITQAQRDAADLQSCQLLFAQAGWPAADFLQSDGAGADLKFEALLIRAKHASKAALLKKTKGITTATPDFGDGLEELQEEFHAAKQSREALEEDQQYSELQRRTTSLSSNVAREALKKTESNSRSSYFGDAGGTLGRRETLHRHSRASILDQAESPHQPAAPDQSEPAPPPPEDLATKTNHAIAQTLPKNAPQDDVLGSVVKQLARCRLDELEKLTACRCRKRQLSLYRALLMQRFLQDIEVDTKKRNEKVEAALNANDTERKKLSKEAADAFFSRLQADGERRKRTREEAIKAAQEAEAAKLEASRKELKDILMNARTKGGSTRPNSALPRQSSAAFALPVTTSRRPASARPQ